MRTCHIFSNTSSAELNLPNWISLLFTLLPRMKASSPLVCFPSVSLLCFHLSLPSKTSVFIPHLLLSHPSLCRTPRRRRVPLQLPNRLRKLECKNSTSLIEATVYWTTEACHRCCYAAFVFFPARLPRLTDHMVIKLVRRIDTHCKKKQTSVEVEANIGGYGPVGMASIALEARYLRFSCLDWH